MRWQADTTVLVVGGTGGVGRHVAAAFRNAGWQVVCVSRRHPSHCLQQRLRTLGDPRILVHDLARETDAEVAALLNHLGCRVVVNAADVWRGTAAAVRHTNVDLVTRLTHGCGRAARDVRLVHLGTIHERSASSEAYVRSKADASQVILSAASRGETDAVALRVVNICGPDVSTSGFISHTAAQLAARRERPGELSRLRLAVADERRDYVDVRDVARAAFRAAGTPQTPTDGIEVGRGEAVPVRDLVDALLRRSPDVARYVDVVTISGRSRPAPTADLRAALALGWRPQVPLERSVQDMWYRAVQQSRSSGALSSYA